MNPETKDWVVPLLRYFIAGLVGMLATFLSKKMGVEVTEENKTFLVNTLTVIGVTIWAAVAAIVSRWMKRWFLRAWHPGEIAPEVQKALMDQGHQVRLGLPRRGL